MLSDALHEHKGTIADDRLDALAYGCLTPDHAAQFKAFVKHLKGKYQLASVIRGDIGWPHEPGDRDVLYFLAQSFRARLIKELPPQEKGMAAAQKELAHRAKALIRDLATISLEIAQMVVSKQGETAALPAWFMVEIVRDLPRLVDKSHGAQ